MLSTPGGPLDGFARGPPPSATIRAHVSPSHPPGDGAGATEPPAAAPSPSRVRRSFNEAAHKLGYWPVAPRRAARDTARHRGGPDAAPTTATWSRKPSKAVLALGALGIVYGDIGTSPLYTVQMIFTTAPLRRAHDHRPASTESRR